MTFERNYSCFCGSGSKKDSGLKRIIHNLEWVCHLTSTQVVVSSTPGSGPADGMVSIEKWCVEWGCLWLWQVKDPLGSIMKSRAFCPSPGYLPQPDIAINVCEPDSINNKCKI